MQDVLVLVGATASGKTELLELLFGPGGPRAGAAELVSADSMQAYRGMDIGTAKPGPSLRAGLPHHLLDIRNPDEPFSAGDFVGLAASAIGEIIGRGRLPIVSGGTGFYVRNLLLGMPTVPVADPAIRADVAADLERLGPGALRSELAAGDPVSAARIHPNDLYRLTRALEIVRATGRPLASFLPERAAAKASAPPAPGPADRRWLLVHYRRPRGELAVRIAARVDAMFAAGLPAEVARLRAAGYGKESPGMKAIGYAEFFELEASGGPGDASPDAIRDRIVLDTLHYAKRQETFFRGLARALSERPAGTFRLVALEASSPSEDAGRLACLLDESFGPDAPGWSSPERGEATHA
ncbi:MAG TPA: tRNA (adenosine(37)-N6)-dimethylallyltransferase MiaA [Rectinemataceae bacterium]|nr:tRNA (adenosine(37)-N6)-dimethylallyltransferase MiaA [Rectinemataceae bacterium]